MAQHEARDDKARLLRILAGLRAFQNAKRPPPPPEPPVVAASGHARLLDYGGTGPAAVFVPSLINPPTILDLSENNSLLRWLGRQGIRPLLVDWGNPDGNDCNLDIGGHVSVVLQDLLRTLNTPYHLVGYCLGGTMAVASAVLAEPLSLTLIAAPWDFDGYDEKARDLLQTLWEKSQPVVDALGLMPMEILQTAFWLLDPQRTVSKYEQFAALDPDSDKARAFIRLEDWANDGPPLTRAAARELVDDFFTVNLPGLKRWEIGGRMVDPSTIRCPIRQITSTTDRIVPAATALGETQNLRLALGHVGMVIGTNAKHALWEPLAQALSQNQTNW